MLYLGELNEMTLNLKFLRVQTGMTLEQLSQDSGLTRSYLSKVERGLSSPSIGTAIKIADALGTTLDKLYGQQDEDGPLTITRAKNGRAGEENTHLSLIAGLSPDRIMRAFIVRPTKTANRGRIMSHHEGEEILFVLTGKIEFLVSKRKEILYPGDCVHFDSTIPHKLTSLGSEPASALVVIADTSAA